MQYNYSGANKAPHLWRRSQRALQNHVEGSNPSAASKGLVIFYITSPFFFFEIIKKILYNIYVKRKKGNKNITYKQAVAIPFEETCIEIIDYYHEAPDYFEFIGTCGGDVMRYRVYKETGKVYEK